MDGGVNNKRELITIIEPRDDIPALGSSNRIWYKVDEHIGCCEEEAFERG